MVKILSVCKKGYSHISYGDFVVGCEYMGVCYGKSYYEMFTKLGVFIGYISYGMFNDHFSGYDMGIISNIDKLFNSIMDE